MKKRQILYNHLKLGHQSKKFRTEIKPMLEGVAAHPRFIPETARRLGDPVFTKDLIISPHWIDRFVEKQEQLLLEVVEGLDNDSKSALALLYMRNGELESPIQLGESEKRALDRFGSSLGGCITAMESLKGSLVQHVHVEGASFWRFKHPTIGDAFAARLVLNPELLEIYLQGSPSEDLLDQVTCGDVGLEKAVIVPKPLFPLILRRLEEFSKSQQYKSFLYASWGAKTRTMNFLTRRCSKEFLSFYLEKHPELVDRVAEPGLLLSTVSEVDLAITLHEQGLLPEAHRRKFVETVTGYALDGLDLEALGNQGIRSVFKGGEFEEFRQEVLTKLVPRLDDVRRDWLSNRRSDESPEDFVQPLKDWLRSLADEFADDDKVKGIVKRERAYIDEWIAEHSDEEQQDRPKRTLGAFETPEEFDDVRSIFDDVDA